MHRTVNGLDLHVEVDNAGAPRVQVYMGEQSVVDTNALSVTGLRNLAAALEAAADMAHDQMDGYYYRQSQSLRNGHERRV